MGSHDSPVPMEDLIMSEPVKHDGMLVSDVVLSQSCQQADAVASEKGAQGLVDELAAFEPILARYIDTRSEIIAGRLALTGAPTPVVQRGYGEMMARPIPPVLAMRRGQHNYWSGSMDDSMAN